MKTKENLDPKTHQSHPAMAPTPKSKPRSLRPMRSMVALRSLKPKMAVASLTMKSEEIEKN